MNNRLWSLVKGELDRLNKYGVFTMSLFIAVLWGVILFLISDDILSSILPMLLLIDATMMSIMYIGAEMHFEKTESTISTLLVTPVTNKELVASKALANIIHNFVSSGLIILVFYLASEFGYVADIGINLFLLLLGVVLTTATFTILGLVLSYYQKDFTTMLVNIFIGAIFLMLPSMLLMFGVISGPFWENFMLINPIEAAQQLIQAGIKDYTFTYKYFISLFYMLGGGIVLYFLVAVPRFQDYAIKESGV
jgi:fluoroquinolone transport system permease protein